MVKVYLFIKRVLDILISLTGIILLFPISIVIKLLYIINKDKYTIFYKQERVGKNGKAFIMYKYRTMIPNASNYLTEVISNNKYEWKKYRKIGNDPRITKIGRILRKSSIDELPQLINVLKGDMSLIGPRPLLKGELDYYKGNHDKYEKYKPGITGYWACNGRNNINYKERLKLEYYYCDNIGLFLDIKIFLKTIIIIIKRVGAK